MSGRRTTRPATVLTPMETGTGCGHRDMATSGFRVTHGVTRRFSAECGTTTMLSGGAGCRAGTDVGRGGAVAATASTWGYFQLDIISQFARLGHFRGRPVAAVALVIRFP